MNAPLVAIGRQPVSFRHNVSSSSTVLLDIDYLSQEGRLCKKINYFTLVGKYITASHFLAGGGTATYEIFVSRAPQASANRSTVASAHAHPRRKLTKRDENRNKRQQRASSI